MYGTSPHYPKSLVMQCGQSLHPTFHIVMAGAPVNIILSLPYLSNTLEAGKYRKVMNGDIIL